MGGVGAGTCVQSELGHVLPFPSERRLPVTQPPEGGESRPCLPSSGGGGPGRSRPDPPAGAGRASGKSWPRSGVQTVISEWSKALWKLRGDAHELSGPHRRRSHRRSWEIPDNRRRDTGQCHGCRPRYTRPEGRGHFRSDGTVNGLDGTRGVSCSPPETLTRDAMAPGELGMRCWAGGSLHPATTRPW